MSIENLLNYFDMPPGYALLDLGCGKGGLVDALRARGLDAFGCDIANSSASDYVEDAVAKDYLRTIEMEPYRLPFDDGQFDVVISQVVLEHVMDYEGTFKEIHRVLKPGGISLHIFPGRYVFIEPHVFVPLATMVRNRPWLYLWALLGIRNQFQTGKPAREVADLNYRYLNEHTNYPPDREIIRHAHLFSEAAFREEIFFKRVPGSQQRQSLKRRLVAFLGAEKLLAWWYRTFSMRALYLKK
jgi:SAM-dependent methyltransferase